MKKILIIIIAITLIGTFVSAIGSLKAKKKGQNRRADSNFTQTTDTGIVIKPTTNIDSNFSEPFLTVGFEKEKIIPSATLKSNYDKLHVALSSGKEGDIPIQYEGGTADDRYARIISDPTKAGNHVLHYWLKNAAIPTGFKGGDYGYKGRIQMNLSGLNHTAVFARYRMYLHPDLKFYKLYPKENYWFMISELWFRRPDGVDFRIHVDIGKEIGVNTPLYFLAAGNVRTGGERGKNDTWDPLWGAMNTKFEVPIGEWIDMEIGYKQGDKDSGRFYLAAKRPSDSAPVTVFDITDWTYNPNAGTPTPLTQWNPLKLYTGIKIIKYIQDNGGVAQIYWDDFELFDRWPD